MASRYSQSPKYDYCFNPIHVVNDDKDIVVPCGKCDGCLLHRAQEWSMRVGCEIESTPFSIFFTHTYSNRYVPFMVPAKKSLIDNSYLWTPNHSFNIRFDGVKDVLRKESFNVLSSWSEPISITNFVNPPDVPYVMPYLSKTDVQLWLKLVRKDLFVNLYGSDKNKYRGFRYFIIGELGSTKFRPHLHGLIFPSDKDQAEYLLQYALYQNWQMSFKDLFYRYSHFCDSGVKGYVTQYLTSFSDLPRIYKEVKEIRPFRLSSKAPAIGHILQDKEKIFEDVSVGVITYTKSISRLGDTFVLEYPSDFMRSQFPKCFGFGRLDFSRILVIYGCILRAFDCRDRWKEFGISFDSLLDGFRKNLHSLDFIAAYRCFRTCQEFRSKGIYLTSFHYVYLLDMYYYKVAISSLRKWYEFQQSCDDPLVILSSYNSSLWYLRDSNELLFANFIEGFGLDVDFWLNSDLKVLQELLYNARVVYHQQYFNDVDDITVDMVKLPKFNEKFGLSPNSQYV